VLKRGLELCAKKERGERRNGNEGADERRRDGGGMGAGVAVGGSGCGAVRCCAVLRWCCSGEGEVWLFGGMGEGRGAGQGASGVVVVVTVVVGRGGLAVGGRRPEATRVGAAARRDEGRRRATGFVFEKKKEMAGLARARARAAEEHIPSSLPAAPR
jgi:hypothetical protein